MCGSIWGIVHFWDYPSVKVLIIKLLRRVRLIISLPESKNGYSIESFLEYSGYFPYAPQLILSYKGQAINITHLYMSLRYPFKKNEMVYHYIFPCSYSYRAFWSGSRFPQVICSGTRTQKIYFLWYTLTEFNWPSLKMSGKTVDTQCQVKRRCLCVRAAIGTCKCLPRLCPLKSHTFLNQWCVASHENMIRPRHCFPYFCLYIIYTLYWCN